MTRFLVLSVVFLPAALAQLTIGGISSTASKVQTTIQLSTDRVPAGSVARVAVTLAIEDTWHVNSHIPTYDYLIGTALEIEPVEGIIVSDLRYPAGHHQQFDFADEPLSVYDRTVTIFLSLRLSEKLEPGEYRVPAKLRVQACNDQVCLAPSTMPLEILLPVVSSGTQVVEQFPELFATYDTKTGEAGTVDSLASLFETEGSFVAFLAIFLIGLALNLTPCVYPMLSVTVSLFGTQSEASTLRVFVKAVVYVLGIASMYSVLGVTAALSGELFGSWLQSPWVLGIIGALLFALALSMFGLYQLQAPYWLTSKLGGTAGTGFVSLFVSGLVVGIFAAPCIGPPVIALLAMVGQKGDPFFGFMAFFVLSLGLGLPYLILGTFSGFLKNVPRSGVWLVWVERIFGVVLTGAALFYLSLAFAPKLAAFVVPLTLIVGGLYLGFFEPSGRDKTSFRRMKWAFGIACIALGGFFANALREPGIEWQPHSPDLVAEAQASGKPVMMDFYADWCIPCLELDRRTFTDPSVIAASEEFVRLKVDLTRFDSPESEALRKQFDIAGVPTIVFLDRTGSEVLSSRVVGYLPPDEFLEKMQNVENSER
ncbi:MAG: cytochrome c biogenesis protein CcdA [Bacteroidota bacterium]